jgi:hypothetical protein
VYPHLVISFADQVRGGGTKSRSHPQPSVRFGWHVRVGFTVRCGAQKNLSAEPYTDGVEKTDEPGRQCRMNLAVRGLEGDIRHGGHGPFRACVVAPCQVRLMKFESAAAK